jgi:hypothetical protein
MPAAHVLLTAVFLVLAAISPWVVWESTALSIERVEVEIAGLPPEFGGFTIAHITDIHGRRLDPAGALVAAVRAAGPDIIVATGDFVDGSLSELGRVTPLIRALREVAPVYAVSGNHDYRAGWPSVAAALRECGVVVLENDHVSLVRGPVQLILAGVSDPTTRRHDLGAAVPQDSAAPVILLAHGPALHQRLRDGEDAEPELALLDAVSLTVAGHTHGGQIKLPLIGAVTNASGRPFPRSYIQGLSWEGSGWLYISRGLGYTILPVRFLSRPELAIVTLRASP